MIRRVAARLLAALLALHLVGTLWVLSQHPFAAPVMERTAAQARLAFERAMARTVTPDWLLPRLQEAVTAGELDRIALYLELASEHGIALPPELAADAAARQAEAEGTLAAAASCAACAWDLTSCQTLALLGACALPVELTPVGDLNALRRAAAAWGAGEAVDRIDAGLAVVGLAATGAVLVSGGTSATAKLGASAIRVGRRMGAVSARLSGVLAETVEGLIRWDRLGGALASGSLDEAVDAARYARLSGMAADLGRVYQNTSAAEAIWLLRHADDAAELNRLARVAEAAGGDTRKVFEVLGKPRTFRLLHRVADLTLLAVGLLASLGATLLSLVLGQALRLLRALAR